MSEKLRNKKILERATQTLSTLKEIVAMDSNLTKDSRSSFEKIKEKKVLSRLTALPVENLKSILGENIDLTQLKKSGITNLSSVYLIELDKLKLMTSLDEEMLQQIKSETNKLYNEIAELIPLGINYDNISTEELNLLSKVKELQSLGNEYELHLPEIKIIILKLEENILQASITESKVKWFFSSKESKNKALKSLETLGILLQENTTGELTEVVKIAIKNHDAATKIDTLGDFKDNASDYFSIIEKNFGREYNSRSTYMNDELVEQINARVFDASKINANLRKYQLFGIKFALTQNRVILGDEMGLGKTLQAVGVLTQRILEGGTHFLVVCPKAVLVNWEREVEGRTALRLVKIHGSTQEQSYNYWLANGGVAITTFDTLKNISVEIFENSNINLNTIITDEAHFVKNPAAGRTKAMYRWVNLAENALFMTGTPQENHPSEFIEIASLVNPEAMGKLHQSYLYQGPELFRKEVSPIYLRRNLEEVLGELPELIETTEYCTFEGADTARYAIYSELGNWMGMRRASFIPSEEYSIPDKMERIKAIVEDSYSKGKKVIIFSYFKDILNAVYKELGSTAYQPITGNTSSFERQKTIDDFTANSSPCTVIGQIQALGTGLNIQAASVVIICEPQIKPSLEVQAIARAHRMGQVSKVYVYRLLAINEDFEGISIDERITDLLARKTDSFNMHVRISELGDASAHLVEGISLKAEEILATNASAQAYKFDDFYEILKVSATATEEEIRVSYEKILEGNQPESVNSEKTLFSEMQKLEIAFEVLSDKKMRANYDKIRNKNV